MIDVYYIEDDGSIAQAVRHYLEQQNCCVKIFTTIADARQAMVRAYPGNSTGGLNMPTGKGTSSVGGFNPDGRNVGYIFDGPGDPMGCSRGFQNGADDYVVKPF